METVSESKDDAFSEVPQRLRTLISKLLDSELVESEGQELASILSNCEVCRSYYLHYIQLHSELSESGGTTVAPAELETDQVYLPNVTPTTDTNPTDNGNVFNWSWMGLGATVSLGLVAAILWFTKTQSRSDSETGSAGESGQPKVAQEPTDLERNGLFTPSEVALSDEDLAVIVRVSPPLSEQLVGKRLKSGTVNLEQGEMQLEFMGGAVVALTSPAELKLVSNENADLISGVAIARVPERARGFTLNAPGAAVVDLGTEFVLEVNPSGSSKVRVLDGEVELSLLGDDGNTLTSHRLQGSTEVEFDQAKRSISAADSAIATSPRVSRPNTQPLNVTEAYAQMVMKSKPLAFWRFEEQEQKDPLIVPNRMGTRLALRVQRNSAEAESVAVADGQLTLRRSKHPRFLITDEPIMPFSADEFSVELWIKPDDLQHATCLAVFPSWSKNADAKLSAIEIVTDTFLIHQPGSIRALYRNPPEQSPDHGINLFTPGMTSPGRWQHVAIVKTSSELKLYFDGQLIKTIPSVSQSENQPFQLLLGQLAIHHHLRQFSGLMDEVAIYDRALEEEEIFSRYQLLAGKQGEKESR